MSLYDPENPQHMDYLARAKESGRRVTERLDDAEIRARVYAILARDQKATAAERAEYEVSKPQPAPTGGLSAGRPDGESLPTDHDGMVEAKEAARLHWQNRRRAAA